MKNIISLLLKNIIANNYYFNIQIANITPENTLLFYFYLIPLSVIVELPYFIIQ